MSSYWKDKKVLVTGGSGFVGHYLGKKLNSVVKHLTLSDRGQCDLLNLKQTRDYFARLDPDVVIHLATYHGGVLLNKEKPADLLYQNAVMNLNVVDASARVGIRKLVIVSAACAYPEEVNNPIKESNLWAGLPHESISSYGVTKRYVTVMASAYRKQYGLNYIFLIFPTMYGPMDSFDLQNSHVVSALIRKFVEAKKNHAKEVVLWGTGLPIREVIYVEDAADAIILATKRYSSPTPLNMGASCGYKIKEIAQIIKGKVDFKGSVLWDKTKPDGQRKRILDSSTAEKLLGWLPKVDLRAGVDKTVDWYLKNPQ